MDSEHTQQVIECDAVIVGGGPAGSVAAILLRNAGWSIVLIEARERHTGKACGHCLNPRALTVLNHIGMQRAVETASTGRTGSLRILHKRRCVTINLATSDGRCTSEWDHERGIIIDRSVLDQQLLDHAANCGVHILQPATVRGIEFGRGCSQVNAHQRHPNEHNADARPRPVNVRAPLVVGADGLNSAVARAAGLAQCASRRRHRGYGFSFHAACRAADERDVVRENEIAMYLCRDGYLGMVRSASKGVPSKGVHCAALVRPGGDVQKPRDPIAFVKRMCREHDLPLGLCEAAAAHVHAAGPIPCDVKAVADDRCALIGDAAGFAEPFTGEGMAWAMESAVLLAETLIDTRPGTWSAATARQYARLYEQQIEIAKRRCHQVGWLLRHQVAAASVMLLAARMPTLASQVAGKVNRA